MPHSVLSLALLAIIAEDYDLAVAFTELVADDIVDWACTDCSMFIQVRSCLRHASSWS